MLELCAKAVMALLPRLDEKNKLICILARLQRRERDIYSSPRYVSSTSTSGKTIGLSHG